MSPDELKALARADDYEQVSLSAVWLYPDGLKALARADDYEHVSLSAV